MPLALKEIADKPTTAPPPKRNRPLRSALPLPRRPGGYIPSREVTSLLTQLGLILETGSPLAPGLRQIAAQTAHPGLKEVAQSLVADLEGGSTFSLALAHHRGLLTPVEVSMLQVGEAGGILAPMVARVLELRERRDQLAAAIRGALIYPAVIMVIAVSVVAFMLAFVFPRFAVLFAGMEGSLPLSTRILMGVTSLFSERWYVIIAVAAAGYTGWRLWTRTAAGARLLDSLKLDLPLVGDIVRNANLSQIFLNLGFLLKAKVPLMNALTVSRGASGHHAYRGLLDEMIDAAERGEGMTQPISRSPLVPGLARGIIATGEETGETDRAFLRLADYYDQQVRRRVKTLTALLEPALLVAMGGLVGFIVVSLVLPIFRLSRGMH